MRPHRHEDAAIYVVNDQVATDDSGYPQAGSIEGLLDALKAHERAVLLSMRSTPVPPVPRLPQNDTGQEPISRLGRADNQELVREIVAPFIHELGAVRQELGRVTAERDALLDALEHGEPDESTVPWLRLLFGRPGKEED